VSTTPGAGDGGRLDAPLGRVSRDVFSGGPLPAAELNTAAVTGMAQQGIDITTELPQPWATRLSARRM
jgi:hypothetical protein